MKLQKATRKQVKLRLNLSAPSGAGKTFSALLMAYGITGDWKKIAVIDTENGSASLYSHLGEFQTLNLEAPYTPERYIEAIQCCQDAEMEVIIIDSSSHEWSGAGGCIEINEKLAQLKYKGNTWSAWNETTPRHDAFIQKVLQCDVHVITCTRSKMETVMGEGKKVHKVGMKDIQRDGWEYELTVSLSIDRDTHMATPSKDRTGLFEGNDSFIITQDTGKRIIEWCNSGKSIEESKVEEEIEFKKRYDSGLELALSECNISKDLISLTAVWNSFKMYQKDELFLSTIKEKKVFLTFTNPAENVA